MKVAAAVYTLASVAVLALMVMRPAVEIANPTVAAPAPEATAAPAAAPVPAVTPTPDAAPAVAPIPAAPVAPPPPAGTAPTNTVPTPGEQASPEEKKNDVAPPATAKPAPDANAVPDYAREQRMASEISPTILDGEIVTLNDGNQNFIGILTPAEQPRGAVIILHGRGLHPDWADVAHPLRVGLAAKGWTTLSLQMPVLEKEAKYYDYVPLFANADKRIDAGIAFLKQKGIAPIVLAAHSCGTHMALNWVGNKGDGDVIAYVGLGMGVTDADQGMVQALPLDKMKVPVLDVYGEKEYPQAISLAPERMALMQKAGNPHSRQMVLPAADHYFKEKGEELTAVVANWLNSLPL